MKLATRWLSRTAYSLAILGCLSGGGLAAEPSASKPIMIAREGAFNVGGKVVGDPNTKSLSCDHGYVDYQIPVNARRVNLFMWHSSSAQVWKNRWDGGEGYESIFLRRGYPVYIWDGPRVGRGNWSCEEIDYKPNLGADQQNFFYWRFGSSYPNWFPGVQFPTDDPEAWKQATAARYDEFDTMKNARLEADAAAKALDKIGPTVLVTNSAGGLRALLATLKTDNVKAIVEYENVTFLFPEGAGPEDRGAFGSTHISKEEFKKFTNIPIQLVYGDNTDKIEAWRGFVAQARQFADLVNAEGGHVEILMLPSVGLKGNTHLAFADMNNVAVADQLSLFLKKNGLDKR